MIVFVLEVTVQKTNYVCFRKNIINSYIYLQQIIRNGKKSLWFRYVEIEFTCYITFVDFIYLLICIVNSAHSKACNTIKNE